MAERTTYGPGRQAIGFTVVLSESMSTVEERTAAWLREHGYPLEMRVAEILRAENVFATHYRIYRDSVTGKLREIDVMGYVDRRPLSVHMVFECKHSRDKPWVLVCTGAPAMASRGFPLAVPCTPSAKKIMLRLAEEKAVQRMDMFDPSPLMGFRLVRAHTGNQDAAAHAVEGLTAACLATAEDIGSHGHSVVYLPVVVIDAPLLQCYLPNATQEVQLQRVPRGVLLHTHGLGEFTLIHVVQVDSLPAFVSAVRENATRLAKLASKKPVRKSARTGKERRG